MKRGAVGMVLLACVAGHGCDDLTDQPRLREQAPTPLFADGSSSREPAQGTVARGQTAQAALAAVRPAMSEALLTRGEAVYQVFCAPCHGLTGAGDGLVVQRGFPAPAPLAAARVRALADIQLLKVIAQGQGAMAGYQAQIDPADRWALVAHIRVLQLSQHAPLSRLTREQRRALEVPGR